MRRLVLAALVALSLCAVASGASASVHRHRAPTLIILVVAGQSNALGYQSYVVDPATHKNVFVEKGSSPADHQVLFTFLESGVQGRALPPVPLDTPQNLSGAPSPVFGPEVGLARYLYNAGHKDLLVVKVAFSGSSLSVDWAKHSRDLQLLVVRVHAAEAWAIGAGWTPTIGGFYWVQGERDATVAAYAAAYRTNLRHLITNVRRQLPLAPTTPIVIGQTDLADFIHFEQLHGLCTSKDCTSEKLWNSEVMRAQASVTGTHVFLSKTSKLPRYDNFLHLSDAAELTLGTEFGSVSRAHV